MFFFVGEGGHREPDEQGPRQRAYPCEVRRFFGFGSTRQHFNSSELRNKMKLFSFGSSLARNTVNTFF